MKKGSHGVTRFIKRMSTGKNGDKAGYHYSIDQTVIDNKEKYDGCYAAATNLDDAAKDILVVNDRCYLT